MIRLTSEVDWDGSPRKILKQSVLNVESERVFLVINVYRKLQIHVIINEIKRQQAIFSSSQTPSSFIRELASFDSKSSPHFEVRYLQAYRLSFTNEEELGCEFTANYKLVFLFDFVKSTIAFSSEFGGFVFIFVVRAIKTLLLQFGYESFNF